MALRGEVLAMVDVSYDDISSSNPSDEIDEREVAAELDAQLVLARSQRTELGGLVRLESAGVFFFGLELVLVVVAFVTIIAYGGGFLKSFPMAPLFLLPLLWQAASSLSRKAQSAQNLKSLASQLDGSIGAAEDARRRTHATEH